MEKTKSLNNFVASVGKILRIIIWLVYEKEVTSFYPTNCQILQSTLKNMSVRFVPNIRPW